MSLIEVYRSDIPGKQTMKVAMLRRAYITELDGVNRFIFTLADGLKSIGHSVEIVTWGFFGVSRPENLSKWAHEKYNVHAKIFSLRDKPCRLDPPPWLRIGWDWLEKGSKLLKRFGYDAVIVNGILPLRFNGKKIAVNHGVNMYSDKADFFKRFVARNLQKLRPGVCVKKTSCRVQEFLPFELSCNSTTTIYFLTQFAKIRREGRLHTSHWYETCEES